MNRRTAGRAARAAGESLEADILSGNRPRWVYLARTSEPTKVVKARGTLTRVAVGAGVADFHGGVHGRLVVMEAKSTREDRWPLKALTDEQARGLDAAMAAGCRAGVILRYDATRRVVWLPWGALGPAWRRWSAGMAERGAASLAWDDALGIGREVVMLRWWEVVL